MTAIKGPDLEFQIAMVALLNASSDLVGLIPGGINPQQASPWPGAYIMVGDGQNIPDLAECIDGSELFFDIHIWSQKDTSFADVNKIAANIWKALDGQTITLTENRCVDFQRGSMHRLRDPDGKTLHGVLTIRALTEPAA